MWARRCRCGVGWPVAGPIAIPCETIITGHLLCYMQGWPEIREGCLGVSVCVLFPVRALTE
jgi:hypothetical protein